MSSTWPVRRTGRRPWCGDTPAPGTRWPLRSSASRRSLSAGSSPSRRTSSTRTPTFSAAAWSRRCPASATGSWPRSASTPTCEPSSFPLPPSRSCQTWTWRVHAAPPSREATRWDGHPQTFPALKPRTNRELTNCAWSARFRLVAEEQDAGGGRYATGEPQPDRPGGLPEQPLSGAEHQRVHEQLVLVDELVFDQRLDEDTAAEHDDGAVPALFQVVDRGDHIARQHVRAGPPQTGQRPRNDVLRGGVQVCRDRVGVRLGWPVRRHVLVGPAAEKIGRGG